MVQVEARFVLQKVRAANISSLATETLDAVRKSCAPSSKNLDLWTKEADAVIQTTPSSMREKQLLPVKITTKTTEERGELLTSFVLFADDRLAVRACFIRPAGMLDK